ncbi:MAG: right-handed parallel beta-helix repeat-containing protein [Acidimicrobiia bacterium]
MQVTTRPEKAVPMGKWKLIGATTVLVVVTATVALAALPPGGTFTDDNGHTFEGAIEAIAAEGITRGCNPPANTRFCPEDHVTRGQMAIFIVRAYNLSAAASDFFTDDTGKVYEDAANRLAQAGLTHGCGPGIYCGDDTITRGEMAAFLSRAENLPGSTTDHFVDDNTSIFELAIDRLGTAGITQGCNPPFNDRFCPEDNVTRGQMAAFLMRALGLTPINPPPPAATLLPIGVSWNPIIAAESAGTTFVVESGVHYGQTANLKHGDALVGQPGAVMDGRNVTDWAVQPNRANNVTVKGLEIRNYSPDDQYAPITARTYGGAAAGIGWTVENCDLHHNSYSGLALSEGSIARNNRIHDNGVIGIEVSWVRSSGALVEGNEIYRNNTTGAYEYYEAGGSKFGDTENLIVRGNFVHDNNGPGLWTDTDNVNTLYENNVVEGNSGAGIFHEISYSATIRNNQVRGNGFRSRGWLWEGGIMIAGSQNVEISGNVVQDNYNGITLIQQDRGSGALGPYLLRNVSVHDNTVIRSGRTGAAQDVGEHSIFTTRNITFQNNDYENVAGFSWADRWLAWSQWRGYGMDLTGSIK